MTDNSTSIIKPKSKFILSGILFVVLMAGLTATYWLAQQNQDIRQQASAPDYYPGDDLCVDSGGTWVGNICYMGGTATCDGPGEGGGDPCAANGGYCSGTDIIRCDCGNGNWVGGKKEVGCSALCGEAGLDCEPSCGENVDPSPRPSENPSPRPSPSVSPSPRPSISPSPSPSPSPSLPPGPQCLDITMNNSSPEIGDEVSFTCGEVVGATNYIFRIMSPDGIISSLDATGQTSEDYLIDQSGAYFAQCQICTGPNEASCHPWEPLPDMI